MDVDQGHLEAPATVMYVGLHTCQNSTGDNQLWYPKWTVNQSAFLIASAKSEHAERAMCLEVDDPWWTLR
ncbi:hypothetical protein ACFXB3_11125 [Streptomyces sp. NPDC059447]|uniref:hypothetical protein n=1 Tax=Streptomyces sp. NPDC059447 TaxID=3346834 RepID=UPI0036911732